MKQRFGLFALCGVGLGALLVGCSQPEAPVGEAIAGAAVADEAVADVGAPSDAGYEPFAPAEIQSIHEQFEPEFPSWFNRGGDFSRYVFLNMSEFFLQSVINKGGPVRALPAEKRQALADFNVTVEAGDMTLAEYVADSPTDGVVIVHKGRIVFESYPRMRPDDVHIWFSVSKTLVSTAVAILEDRGAIDANRPIGAYIEEMRGTAWEEIRIVDILDMASGVDCPEVRDDLGSCFWAQYYAYGWPLSDASKGDWVSIYQSMGMVRPPGSAFEYTSVNTEALRWLVDVVTGERFADFVERELWRPVGAEANALMTATPEGGAFSAGGMSSTLRDMARWGLMFTPSGRRGPNPVISDAYLAKIQEGGRGALCDDACRTQRRAGLGDDSFRHNSYQWDIVTTDGDFFKGGAGGQGLYVSPSKDLVVAWFGTHTPESKRTEMLQIARRIATSDVLGR